MNATAVRPLWTPSIGTAYVYVLSLFCRKPRHYWGGNSLTEYAWRHLFAALEVAEAKDASSISAAETWKTRCMMEVRNSTTNPRRYLSSIVDDGTLPIFKLSSSKRFFLVNNNMNQKNPWDVSFEVYPHQYTIHVPYHTIPSL